MKVIKCIVCVALLVGFMGLGINTMTAEGGLGGVVPEVRLPDNFVERAFLADAFEEKTLIRFNTIGMAKDEYWLGKVGAFGETVIKIKSDNFGPRVIYIDKLVSMVVVTSSQE